MRDRRDAKSTDFRRGAFCFAVLNVNRFACGGDRDLSIRSRLRLGVLFQGLSMQVTLGSVPRKIGPRKCKTLSSRAVWCHVR